MCGIVGEFSSTVDVQVIRRLTGMMSRRGPDDDGIWTDDHVCALGFRRLAILDLSPNGHQPMLTPDERYAIVFNGEIYNYQEIRRRLEQEGVRFRSSGDSETLLYALARWGTDALAMLNGMFALAFYDRERRTLLIARDHAGIKPLYYLRKPSGLVFASQFDQLLAHPWGADLDVSNTALAIYLEQGYIPAPYALYEDTAMLEPGGWLEIDAEGKVRQGRFYEFPAYREPDLSGHAAYEAVDNAVAAAVKRQLISDVPVGTFLSGGIDSPLVSAKIASLVNEPFKAFTIRIAGDEMDESADAASYARQLGLQHIVADITPQHMLDHLVEMLSCLSEPLADYSILPTYLVSQVARQHVTVALSGDGGDELFWGYARRFSRVIRSAEQFSQPHLVRMARYGAKKYLKIGSATHDIVSRTVGERYRSAHRFMPIALARSLFPTLPEWSSEITLFDFDDSRVDHVAQWLRWNEFVGHLTRVLLKVDRASMHHALEVRVPLLDREVIDVATRIDWRTCLDPHAEIGKQPLRQSLARHVQQQTLSKRGFSIPLAQWLRGPLRPLIEDLVLPASDFMGLPVHRPTLQRMSREFLSGSVNHVNALWVLINLKLWSGNRVSSATPAGI
ncbi:MAG: asparagine synthase (glutamine-hydrolyzing) [Anaerolineae bacterium]|nr:asparagine synthase (glutamine-hydrolyzing) [Anaerolineae bacterium]